MNAAVPLPAIAGAVLHDGDRVLVAFADDDVDPARFGSVADTLREQFPNVQFTFLAGATVVIDRS